MHGPSEQPYGAMFADDLLFLCGGRLEFAMSVHQFARSCPGMSYGVSADHLVCMATRRAPVRHRQQYLVPECGRDRHHTGGKPMPLNQVWCHFFGSTTCACADNGYDYGTVRYYGPTTPRVNGHHPGIIATNPLTKRGRRRLHPRWYYIMDCSEPIWLNRLGSLMKIASRCFLVA